MFADLLNAERKKLGLTQAQIAKLLQVSPRTIWKWEHCEEPLTYEQEGILAMLEKARPKGRKGK